MANNKLPQNIPDPDFDWKRIAKLANLSRALDLYEESELVPNKKILYQFSAKGHEVAQILLASQLNHKHDAVCGYYRSRPTLLSFGVSPEEAVGSAMARAGGYSDGRDIGAVFNFANPNGPSALPMCGGVGAQYTPSVGWAQAIEYRRTVLKDKSYEGAIAVALGGDASVATNGFWSALTMATTLKLPVLFYIEDNGYGISVPSDLQTPGKNIAKNLASFQNLTIFDGDGTNPCEASALAKEAVQKVRDREGPVLLRLTVPRLMGHSAQDTQTYKSEEQIAEEVARDPMPKLREFLVGPILEEKDWEEIEEKARAEVITHVENADKRPDPEADEITRHVFADNFGDGTDETQLMGGLKAEGIKLPEGFDEPDSEGSRINLVTAIRRTLEGELEANNRLLIFGEDVGPKGGAHAVTIGLQDKFGDKRVFDTSLSEEGIIGRAVGMAMAGLMPVPEIQFRKYVDPAVEQLNDCGTMRWRTNNHFAAPMVVRIPVGYFKCGDPWHSQTNEVQFAHAIGWKVAMPSNAEDAVGLLRSAMRGNDPVMFFEHRSMLDAPFARRPWPGDNYVLPFGKAKTTKEGDDVTIVAWGAMVEVAELAAEASDSSVEVIDLRTIIPWDKEAVLASVAKTNRCIVLHEDNITAGFGAEVVARIADEGFLDLDAPVARIAMPDIPSPHAPKLLNAVVPSVQDVLSKIQELVAF